MLRMLLIVRKNSTCKLDKNCAQAYLILYTYTQRSAVDLSTRFKLPRARTVDVISNF